MSRRKEMSKQALLDPADLQESASLNKDVGPSAFNNMDPDTDLLKKDNKSLPMNSTLCNLPAFLGLVGIGIPLWIGVLIPLALVSIIFMLLFRILLWPCTKTVNKHRENPTELINKIAKKSSDTNRKFDIVMFGATGFTGRLSCLYLARQYGTSIRWAIAGRRKDALEKIRSELVAINKDLADLPIIIADSNNAKSLDDMTSETKAVVTTAGPFDRYGSSLVKSCVLHGTHYCDITGEVDWVREMIDQFDDVAKVSGARIVSLCGHDCVPWDLTVLQCANHLKKKGDTIKEVRFYDELNGSFSGGTLETVFHHLSNRAKYTRILDYDPWLKNLNGDKSSNTLIGKNQLFLGYRCEFSSWVGFFVMADVMSDCVRRSNVLNNYSPKMVYNEAMVFANFTSGFINTFGLIMFATAMVFPPIKWFMRKYALPAPGQGPSERAMDHGFLKLTAFAVGTNGNKSKAIFYLPTDPGYRETSRMLVESGLALALEGDKIKVGGGVFTPAACQGDVLLQRLLNTGASFHIE